MAGLLELKAGLVTTLVASGGVVTNNNATIANAASNLVNSTGLDNACTLRLAAAAASAPAEGATVACYLVPKADGAAIATVDLATPYINPNYFVGNFVWPFASSAASSIMDIDGVPLSAIDYAAYLINSLGQNLAAGWSLTSYGTKGQYT